MRALAVVAVMIYHANSEWLPGGFLGVEVFFVISGYLITLLLIAEKERTGRVHLGHFWMRRARRLLPALFVMMFMLITYTTIFRSDALGKLRGDVLGGLFYVSNWYQIWVGAGLQLDRGLRAAAPPVEPRRRGAVLPAVAAGDGGVAAGRDTSCVRHGQVARRRRLGGHARDGVAVPPGSGRRVQRHAGARTGRSPTAASRRPTRCTWRRSHGRAGCCSGRRSRWCGGRTR